MAFCRFCGKELVNDQCDCYEFQASIGNVAESENAQYQQQYEKRKDPFIAPSYNPDFSSFRGFISSFNFNFSSLSGFVSSLREQSGMSEPAANTKDPFERNVPIVPDCIQPEENEVVVKQYNIAKLRTRLKFMKAEGRLMVTNRRVLFRATGTSLTGNLAQEHQFKLDEIGGVEIHKDYKFSLLNLIFCFLLDIPAVFLATLLVSGLSLSEGFSFILGLIFGITGLIPTFIVYKRFWFKLFCANVGVGCIGMAFMASRDSIFLLILVGIISIVVYIVALIDLMIVCFVPNLVMKIKTNGAMGAVVIGSQKSLYKRIKNAGGEYSGFVEVMPWEDTIMAMNELGTMIDDLQKHGDYAIEKWAGELYH